MEINVKGHAGDKAKIAMKVFPKSATSIFKGIKSNKKEFFPELTFQEIGVFPCKVNFEFKFDSRPWNINLEFEGGAIFTTSNKKQGLNDSVILKPDILKIRVNYITQEL